ncbi:response regulator [Clostridium sp. HCP1S3_B4]|uniref:response regulator n=1 Tax=unclassified Clostridium TaxID=2614128 RepID=UPI002A76DC59|nr:response regulator [Clostridiales bacterium]MDY2729136.1 response regulator [Clostridium sp.]
MKYNILVSDDEKEILEIIELYLDKEGYNIITASDGNKALEIINSDIELHLAILDIMMPGMDGYKRSWV